MAAWETFDGQRIDGPFEEALLLESIGRGLDPAIVVRQAGAEEWKPLSAYPHFALAAEKAKARDAARPQPHPWRRPLTPIGLAAVLLALFVVNTLWVGLGARIEAHCNTTGFGDAACDFANRGFLPASGCSTIVIRKTGGVFTDHEGLRSAPMCSGVVWPSSHTSASSRLAFMSQNPASYCAENGGSWPHSCAVSVEAAP